jgi:hypothetical protein
MRSRKDIQRAIGHLEEAYPIAQARNEPEAPFLLMAIDILRWTLGDTTTRFSSLIEGCDVLTQIEQALKAWPGTIH